MLVSTIWASSPPRLPVGRAQVRDPGYLGAHRRPVAVRAVATDAEPLERPPPPIRPTNRRLARRAGGRRARPRLRPGRLRREARLRRFRRCLRLLLGDDLPTVPEVPDQRHQEGHLSRPEFGFHRGHHPLAVADGDQQLVVSPRAVPVGLGEIGDPSHQLAGGFPSTIRLVTLQAVGAIELDRPQPIDRGPIPPRTIPGPAGRRHDDPGRGRRARSLGPKDREADQDQDQAGTAGDRALTATGPTNEGNHLKDLAFRGGAAVEMQWGRGRSPRRLAHAPSSLRRTPKLFLSAKVCGRGDLDARFAGKHGFSRSDARRSGIVSQFGGNRPTR